MFSRVSIPMFNVLVFAYYLISSCYGYFLAFIEQIFSFKKNADFLFSPLVVAIRDLDKVPTSLSILIRSTLAEQDLDALILDVLSFCLETHILTISLCLPEKSFLMAKPPKFDEFSVLQFHEDDAFKSFVLRSSGQTSDIIDLRLICRHKSNSSPWLSRLSDSISPDLVIVYDNTRYNYLDGYPCLYLKDAELYFIRLGRPQTVRRDLIQALLFYSKTHQRFGK